MKVMSSKNNMRLTLDFIVVLQVYNEVILLSTSEVKHGIGLSKLDDRQG